MDNKGITSTFMVKLLISEVMFVCMFIKGVMMKSMLL